MIEPEPEWIAEMKAFIKDGTLLQPHSNSDRDTRALHERISRRSKNYVLIGEKLYRRGAQSRILQKCISQEEGQQLLGEIHEGICGNHAGARTIVSKAFRSGFYWPTVVVDAEVLVRRCEGCQFFTQQIHAPAQALQPISLS